MINLRTFSYYSYFFVIIFNEKTRCQGDCDNGLTSPDGKCCANYHMVNGSCQVCPVGYFGSECTVPCYYPTFGMFCEQECECNLTDCNHMYGCESNGDCENDKTKSSGGCCTNYHMVDGSCEACPVGYFGSRCGVPCQYPTFGWLCIDECNCSQSECNHVHGCKRDASTAPITTAIQNNSSSNIVTSHRFAIPIVTTYRPSITNPSIEFNSTTLTLIIGAVVIFFLMVIIIFQIYERNCKNRERKVPASHVQRSTYEATAESVYCDIDDRYETMETNSPPTVHKREDIPLCEVTSDLQLVPLAPLKNDQTGSSGPGWEESSDEKSTEPEVSSSNSTSSDGSYSKPVTTDNKHKYAKIIDSADTDGIFCIESSETREGELNVLPNHDAENETVIGVDSKDNPYLDVIHN
eukprot:XP_011412953.1 PREDICTED: uncharacterized protein LOC105317866 [Crassostrea gigas]